MIGNQENNYYSNHQNYLMIRDRAFQKSDKSWTYFANDSAYHYDKFLEILIN